MLSTVEKPAIVQERRIKMDTGIIEKIDHIKERITELRGHL